MKTTNELLEAIAKEVLGIENPQEHDSDHEDSHELAVWTLRAVS